MAAQQGLASAAMTLRELRELDNPVESEVASVAARAPKGCKYALFHQRREIHDAQRAVDGMLRRRDQMRDPGLAAGAFRFAEAGRSLFHESMRRAASMHNASLTNRTTASESAR